MEGKGLDSRALKAEARRLRQAGDVEGAERLEGRVFDMAWLDEKGGGGGAAPPGLCLHDVRARPSRSAASEKGIYISRKMSLARRTFQPLSLDGVSRLA